MEIDPSSKSGILSPAEQRLFADRRDVVFSLNDLDAVWGLYTEASARLANLRDSRGNLVGLTGAQYTHHVQWREKAIATLEHLTGQLQLLLPDDPRLTSITDKDIYDWLSDD